MPNGGCKREKWMQKVPTQGRFVSERRERLPIGARGRSRPAVSALPSGRSMLGVCARHVRARGAEGGRICVFYNYNYSSTV